MIIPIFGKMSIEVYTDGAAKGNPGPGGYGIVMRSGKHYKEMSCGFRMTTNNRMELLSVIVALEQIKKTNAEVTVWSDSKYVVDAVEKGWLFGWEKKAFKGKKNVDLWQRFLRIYSKHRVRFHWIKGHAGHPENERCDELAVKASESGKLEVDAVFEASKQGGD